MRHIILILLALLVLQAQELKIIYDCSSSDASYIKSRMWLIGKTIDMIKENKDSSDTILTLHGDCVPMVSKEYEMIVDEKDLEDTKKAQEYLTSLSKRKNVQIIVCEMSLARKSIEKDDVLEFINISKNSFIDTIKYQNKGYALMTFK